MKFCPEHWRDTQEKLHAAGLGRYIADDAREAARRKQAGEFDPLIGAAEAIVTNAVDRAPELPSLAECPLCYLLSKCSCRAGADCEFRGWTAMAVAEQIQVARQLRLLVIRP